MKASKNISNRVRGFFISAFFLAALAAFSIQKGMANEDLPIAEGGGYRISLQLTEDKQGAVAVLSENGKVVGTGDDILALIGECPDPKARKTLLEDYVQKDIASHGGAAEYQKGINANLEKFGATVYNFLPKEVAELYSKYGVVFSPKTEDGGDGQTVEKSGD